MKSRRMPHIRRGRGDVARDAAVAESHIDDAALRLDEKHTAKCLTNGRNAKGSMCVRAACTGVKHCGAMDAYRVVRRMSHMLVDTITALFQARMLRVADQLHRSQTKQTAVGALTLEVEAT